jgi:hypothetical protein
LDKISAIFSIVWLSPKTESELNSRFAFQAAIDWLKEVSDDDLNDFLPQLLEALKHETWCFPGSML